MTARTKILLVVLFIVIVIAGGVYYVRSREGGVGVIIPPKIEEIKKTFVPKTATMTLTSSGDIAKVGQPLNVSLTFSTTKPDIAAFDAVISYDPQILRVDEIRAGDIFQSSPRKLIQPDKKRLVITGVQTDLAQKLTTTSGELATLVLTPLKPGVSKLEFVVSDDKYTNMMNKTPANVLGKTEGVEIQIGE